MAPTPTSSPLVPGLPLQLELREGKYADLYFSTVRSVAGGRVIIDPPRVGAIQLPSVAGPQFLVHFKEGRVDCSFAAQLLPVKDRQGNLFCAFPVPKQINRTQRRRFARVKCELPVTFRRQVGIRLAAPAAGRFIDLSGAGAKLTTGLETDLEPGARLQLAFTIEPGVALVGVTGEVVKVSVQSGGRLDFAVKFVGLAEADRQNLIRYVYQQQLRQKREVGQP